MARFIPHYANDWCHVCGDREDQLAEVHYSENAERFEGPHTKGFRICLKCARIVMETALLARIRPETRAIESPRAKRKRLAGAMH